MPFSVWMPRICNTYEFIKNDDEYAAMKEKKESLYDKLPVSKRSVDFVLWTAVGLLAIVVVLIALEAAGIYKLHL